MNVRSWLLSSCNVLDLIARYEHANSSDGSRGVGGSGQGGMRCSQVWPDLHSDRRHWCRCALTETGGTHSSRGAFLLANSIIALQIWRWTVSDTVRSVACCCASHFKLGSRGIKYLNSNSSSGSLLKGLLPFLASVKSLSPRKLELQRGVFSP